MWGGRDVEAELGIPLATKDPRYIGFPFFRVRDHFNLGSSPSVPFLSHVTDIQGTVKFSQVRAKHLFKWGFDASRVRYNQPFANAIRGNHQILGRFTNSSPADLLLGLVQWSIRRTGPAESYLRSTSYGMYFNDDYRVMPRLTLNLGARYEINKPPIDRYNRLSNFDPGLRKLVIAGDEGIPDLPDRLERGGVADLVMLARDVGAPRSLVHTDYNNFSPRLGFAWRPFTGDRTVIRGGYGIFYSGYLLDPVRASLATVYPFTALESTFSRSGEPRSLSHPFPEDETNLDVASGGIFLGGFDTRPPTGYVQSWSLTVERDLGGGTALETAYVGSRGLHQGLRYNLNQPFRSRELFEAWQAFPRPFPEASAIDYYSFGSSSIYHAAQVSLRRRAGGGLFYRVNYTWSKSIDDASSTVNNFYFSPQNPRDLKTERGRSNFDRRHVFNASWAWELPVGKGKAWWGGAGGLAQALLGGWQLSGTAHLYSGDPITVITGDFADLLGESWRPNRIRSGFQPRQPALGKKGVDYPWYQPEAFEVVPCLGEPRCQPSQYGFEPFGFGNSGRNILDGPGLATINFGLMKNFRFKESRRFQLRWELFNAFNRVNLRRPNEAVDSFSAGLVRSVSRSTRGGGPRVMQFALKFEF